MQVGVKKRKKGKSGSVKVKASNNRLRLVFSFDSKRHYLSLGLTGSHVRLSQTREKKA